MIYFCMLAFDDNINKEAVFITHNGSKHDSYLILSYHEDIILNNTTSTLYNLFRNYH